jgi:hypothetical protein
MNTFTDAADATTYIGGIFEASFADPSISAVLAKSGLVLKMQMTDPDLDLTADLVNGVLYTGADAPSANMTMVLDAGTANRFWQGKVSLPLAIGRGQITLSGALPKLIGLLPSAKPMQVAYTARLKADGRTDLLA